MYINLLANTINYLNIINAKPKPKKKKKLKLYKIVFVFIQLIDGLSNLIIIVAL